MLTLPLLALDASSTRCVAGLWADGAMHGEISREGPTGEAALLPRLVADLLDAQSVAPRSLAGIAVVVGPGSFTGIRASLAFAHGLSFAADCPIIAVTVAEALAEAVGPRQGVGLWCALDARKGRVFLSRSDDPADWLATMIDAAPMPDGTTLIVGDAAVPLCDALVARGAAVSPVAARRPELAEVAAAAMKRLRGERPALAPLPLYIDAPRALPPRGGLRPPPGSAS
jgi:tRNA threonylcarbamoyladenosine biosynthesis protein TsaB